MTSSEDNRVSIPPHMSGIGLTDDRSLCFISPLGFSFCGFLLVSAGNWHRYTLSSTHCQFLFSSTAAREHVKSWIRIFGSCLAGPLPGLHQGA